MYYLSFLLLLCIFFTTGCGSSIVPPRSTPAQPFPPQKQSSQPNKSFTSKTYGHRSVSKNFYRGKNTHLEERSLKQIAKNLNDLFNEFNLKTDPHRDFCISLDNNSYKGPLLNVLAQRAVKNHINNKHISNLRTIAVRFKNLIGEKAFEEHIMAQNDKGKNTYEVLHPWPQRWALYALDRKTNITSEMIIDEAGYTPSHKSRFLWFISSYFNHKDQNERATALARMLNLEGVLNAPKRHALIKKTKLIGKAILRNSSKEVVTAFLNGLLPGSPKFHLIAHALTSNNKAMKEKVTDIDCVVIKDKRMIEIAIREFYREAKENSNAMDPIVGARLALANVTKLIASKFPQLSLSNEPSLLSYKAIDPFDQGEKANLFFKLLEQYLSDCAGGYTKVLAQNLAPSARVWGLGVKPLADAFKDRIMEDNKNALWSSYLCEEYEIGYNPREERPFELSSITLVSLLTNNEEESERLEEWLSISQ